MASKRDEESSTKTTEKKTTSTTSSKHTSSTSSKDHTETSKSTSHTTSEESNQPTSSVTTHATSTSTDGLKSQVTSIISEIAGHKTSDVSLATPSPTSLSTSASNAAITATGSSNDLSSTSSSSARSSSTMAPGTIAGIVIGTIATASLLALVILLWIRMQRSRRNYQGMDSATAERRMSPPDEKDGKLMRYSQEMSSSASNASRPRSWSGGASRRFSHLPVLETTPVPIRPSPSRQSTWSVVKSPSHEFLVSSTSLPSQVAPSTRVLHSDTTGSPGERSLVSPMSSRIGDGTSLSADLVSPVGRRTVSPVQDETVNELAAQQPRRSMATAGNERNAANPFSDGIAGGNAKLKRTSQVAKLRVIETRPEIEVDAPMVSPLEEFYDSRQSVGPRTPSPAVDGSYSRK